ncbi:hypothetical protein Holit_01236 [Hollandina sp. SP2]
MSLRIVQNTAKAGGKIRLGDRLIEATSGNTDIGVVLIAAVKGYKLIVDSSGGIKASFDKMVEHIAQWGLFSRAYA